MGLHGASLHVAPLVGWGVHKALPPPPSLTRFVFFSGGASLGPPCQTPSPSDERRSAILPLVNLRCLLPEVVQLVCWCCSVLLVVVMLHPSTLCLMMLLSQAAAIRGLLRLMLLVAAPQCLGHPL